MTATPSSAVRNGVAIDQLFATINTVKDDLPLAAFRWQATNVWLSGTHSRTTIEAFSGAGGEQHHRTEFTYDADHPAVLCGDDAAPAPVEFLLHALASCLTGGIASVAAARRIELTSVESAISGEMDLQGILGLSDSVRNGYQRMQVNFRIAGDATEDDLRRVVEQATARSAVFDVIANQVPVDIDVVAV